MPKTKLSPAMTVDQFERGYWYAVELKAFAKRLGIRSPGSLRKDQLEAAITHVLVTGAVKNDPGVRRRARGVRDVDRGLRLDLPVVMYTNDAETKAFLEREAAKLAPGSRRKSGARYRLNRWREQQIANGVRLTYRDLARECARLNQTPGAFAQVPTATGRYVNFVSDFFAAEKSATRRDVLQAWRQVKALDMPKTYRAWAGWRRGRRS